MRKARLISLCLLLVLSVAIIGYGVYAASTVNMSANGTIAFISNDVKADIECYVGSDSGTASKTVTFTYIRALSFPNTILSSVLHAITGDWLCIYETISSAG